MTLKETLGHADIRTTSIYLALSAQQLIAQQRKNTLVDGIALPKAVRRKTEKLSWAAGAYRCAVGRAHGAIGFHKGDDE